MKINLDIIPDDHLSTKDSVTSLHSHKLTKPVFSPDLGKSYQIPSHPLGIYSADLWPVGFTSDEWMYVWNSKPLRIKPYLRRTSPANPSYFHATHEDQFKGALWRLTISAPEKGKNIPMFSHGQVVTYCNCNRINRWYIIDPAHTKAKPLLISASYVLRPIEKCSMPNPAILLSFLQYQKSSAMLECIRIWTIYPLLTKAEHKSGSTAGTHR